jgi:polar amino acid transport system ATP-binding protein
MPSTETRADQPLVSCATFICRSAATRSSRASIWMFSRGQAVSIIGPSGSGKSTILRCITGLLRPQRGAIRVGHTEVDTLNTEAS